jgi:hypothetical protein
MQSVVSTRRGNVYCAGGRMQAALYKPLLILACLASPSAAPGQLARTVDFSEKPGAVTLTYAGAEVTLQPIRSGDDEEAIDVSAAIRVPGYQSIIVTEGYGSSPSFERWVGIGKLAEGDAAPSVLLGGYTGGAHCCATLKAIVPDGGKLKIVEFEEIDGGPDEAFPRDLDQDGMVDFVRQDDSFRYQFASGAGSSSPPLIYNIYKGQLVDVTTQPSFQEVWEAFAAETRRRCADRTDKDRNGACAAYVAAAARLGRYETAMKEVEKLAYAGPSIELPKGCRISVRNGDCPAGQEMAFHTFPSALRWFLQKQGYLD